MIETHWWFIPALLLCAILGALIGVAVARLLR